MASEIKVDTISEKTANNTLKLSNTVSEDVTAVTSSSGTLTLNAAEGGFFTVALSENVTTWTISNLPAEDTVQAKEIINYGINNQFAVYVNGERFTGLI